LATILPAMILPDIYDDPLPAPMSRFAHQCAGLHTRPFSGMAGDCPQKGCAPI
jgi:hypothetical protein